MVSSKRTDALRHRLHDAVLFLILLEMRARGGRPPAMAMRIARGHGLDRPGAALGPDPMEVDWDLLVAMSVADAPPKSAGLDRSRPSSGPSDASAGGSPP